jgi:CRISPR-associated protein Cmr4
MFQATRMLFIYVETPLHAGSGRGLGAVDLPIQRERTTNYPMVQASSLKGRVRGEARAKTKDEPTAEERAQGWLGKKEFLAIFGPEAGEGASEHAGAISFGDARILLFPVRSLAGVFAWTTSVDALERFKRAVEITKNGTTTLEFKWNLSEPSGDSAIVNGRALVAGESVVLEEFSFTPQENTMVGEIGRWLADNALPKGAEYQYWRDQLPNKLCILPENAFRDFAQYATEVQTHIKIDPDKKTVAGGALWTSESLPTDTLLYAPVMATDARTKVNGNGMKADEVLRRVVDLNLERTQLGGDETTGQGFVALRFSNGGGQ